MTFSEHCYGVPNTYLSYETSQNVNTPFFEDQIIPSSDSHVQWKTIGSAKFIEKMIIPVLKNFY